MTPVRWIAATIGLLAGLPGWLQPSAAATLRVVSELHGPTVRLSDLFAGLDAGQDCALGDAPGPGSRLVIQQPQLEAIATQFGVNWDASPSEQTVTLERSGRHLSETAVLSMVRAAVLSKSRNAEASVSLTGFQDQQIDVDAVVTVDEVTTDGPGDHFQAVIVGRVDNHETLRLPVQGRVERLVSMPVPVRAIPAGQVIDEQDLVEAAVPADRLHGDVVERSDEAIGLISPHGLAPGMPIVRSDLRRPDIVLRGGAILMRLTSGGIDVAAQGQSLETGAMAERIRVLNPVSHAVLVATIIGPGEVRVDPDSLPALQGGPMGFGGPMRPGSGAFFAAGLSRSGSASLGGNP